jgi:hypothetical protein
VGLLQAAEKLSGCGEIRRKHTSAAKADIDLIGFMPGINPRPTSRTSFSTACLTPTFGLCAKEVEWTANLGKKF